MDYTKFYSLILADLNAVNWISAYVSIYNKAPFELLEGVRNGLVNDMETSQVIESVTEGIRAEFNA
jgi:hypothetical protein